MGPASAGARARRFPVIAGNRGPGIQNDSVEVGDLSAGGQNYLDFPVTSGIMQLFQGGPYAAPFTINPDP